MSIGGNIAATAAAPMNVQVAPAVAKEVKVPIGRVAVRCELRTSGKAALFQEKTKANIEVTMRPGRTSGRVIRRITVCHLAPSTRAASSSSIGTSSMKLFISQTENG